MKEIKNQKGNLIMKNDTLQQKNELTNSKVEKKLLLKK